MVGILILVHQHIAELFLIVRPHLFLLPQEPDGVEDDVIKVQGPRRPQLFFIGYVEVGDLLQADIPLGPALLHIVRSQQHIVFRAGDIAQYTPGREHLIVQVLFLQALLYNAQGVVRVINGKGGGKAQTFNVSPEDTHTGGVKGRRPDIPRGGPDGVLQTGLQLPCRLVGKGDGNDLPGHGRVQGAQGLGPAVHGLRWLGLLGVSF